MSRRRTLLDRTLDWWQLASEPQRDTRRLIAVMIALLIGIVFVGEPALMLR